MTRRTGDWRLRPNRIGYVHASFHRTQETFTARRKLRQIFSRKFNSIFLRQFKAWRPVVTRSLRRHLPLQPSSVALSLSAQKHFHTLRLRRSKSAVFRQHRTANAAQPVATAVNDRPARRTAPATRFNLGGCFQAAENEWQALFVIAIGPSNTQICCTHDLYPSSRHRQ